MRVTVGLIGFAARNDMTRKKHHTHLSAYRRRWGLTQSELAYMLGLRGNPRISRLEYGKSEPPLHVAFGLQVVFGEVASELFPTMFVEIEEEVLTRAYELYERLQGSKARLTKVKLDFLEDMFERAKRNRKRGI